MITIQVQKIEVTKDVDRNKIYTPVDITDQVIMPIIDVERLDNTLDTSSLTLINTEAEAIKPFTRVIIRLDDGTTKQNIYRLVYKDETELAVYGLQKKYKHYVELIEPTKWLERFEVDNTTITNLLAFLYEDPYTGKEVIQPFSKKKYSQSTATTDLWLDFEQYKYGNNYKPFYATYANNELINFQNTQMDVGINYKVGNVGMRTGTFLATLKSYYITPPSREVSQIINVYGDGTWHNPTYTLTQPGNYEITQVYEAEYNGALYRRTYKWSIKILTPTQTANKPQRKTIAETLQIVLQRVGDETSVLRENESPMFSIDADIIDKYGKIPSPEFTFSQNTLFGVLEQIGEEIHSIPRLKPNEIELGNGEVDDWSDWTLITFDELGGNEEAQSGQVVGQDRRFNGDNYATNYTTNVENSFQTNKEDYIAITEPYNGGFISARTESFDFEVSANSACIKLSRPVQRIVKLICRINENGNLRDVDITPYVKEATDYSLLDDYTPTSQATPSIGSKEFAIYYTRGDNVIRGLEYVKPTKWSVAQLWTYQAIFNILHRATGGTFNADWTSGYQMPDLMFQIKYVPYYGLKLKQYKGTIEEDSGNNELFFNQQNSQMVDIEAYGENLKGALLRTANEEITRTEFYNTLASVVRTGQLRGQYYAYQVNKEITNNRVKTTTEYSKNWNKWNEYVAIKKNYRQWEISERESVNTNPVKNEFLIATQKNSAEERGLNEVIVSWSPVDEEQTLPTVNNFWGWMSGTTLPTQAQITAFAESQFTSEYDQLQTNDEVIFTLTTNEKIYKYYYNEITQEWTGYEAVPVYMRGNYVGTVKVRADGNRAPGVHITSLPENWGFNSVYFYSMADQVTGHRLYKTANQTDFSTLSELESAQTFYDYTGQEVYKAYGDFALVSGTNKGYTWQLDPNDGEVWVLTDDPAPSNYPNTINYAITLTEFVKKAKGVVQENDMVFVAYYPAIEPTFRIYRYENGQWVERQRTQLNKKNENGYGIQNVDYLIEQYSGDGFASRPAFMQIKSRIAGLTLAESTKTFKAIDWVVMTTKSEEYSEGNYTEVKSTFIAPCACFTFGNSIVVNFQTKDNYASNTFIEDKKMDEGKLYTLENNVKYSDKYGNFNNFTLVFGGGNAKTDGFNTMANSLVTSKEFYKFDEANLNEDAVLLDYRENAFQFVKDSRQQISYTGQLHFVSDEHAVVFGKAFAEAMPFVGNTSVTSGEIKFVGFTEKPDKFLANEAKSFEILTNNTEYNAFTKTITLKFNNTTQSDFVGVGIIDKNNNIMLYFDKEIEAGDTETLYLEIRDNI